MGAQDGHCWHDQSIVDVIVSYILLAGTVALEVLAVLPIKAGDVRGTGILSRRGHTELSPLHKSIAKVDFSTSVVTVTDLCFLHAKDGGSWHMLLSREVSNSLMDLVMERRVMISREGSRRRGSTRATPTPSRGCWKQACRRSQILPREGVDVSNSTLNATRHTDVEPSGEVLLLG
ncbi:hypothetical protein E2562_000258 [Oryza meyeriana var. granulata]|uniref:Uncharacterized protein n=1 Tax=Oryza meyeriana var. granulata TaxID=110450 RepID=A0A6G1CL48_9ORYZ|nr:hypothetical protein E2562_000258 [Oryza meyeriana var. granulata]